MTRDKSSVEVAVGLAGWNFPADHPTRTAEKKEKDGTVTKKKYYVIPVEYVLIEDDDVEYTEDVGKALRDNGVDDIVKEMNAGLKLAQGDAAKAPFKTNEGSLVDALKWAGKEASVGRPEVFKEYITRSVTNEKDAGAWLKEQYRAIL